METNKTIALWAYALLIGGGLMFLLVYLYYYSPETIQGIIPANVAATTSVATTTVTDQSGNVSVYSSMFRIN